MNQENWLKLQSIDNEIRSLKINISDGNSHHRYYALQRKGKHPDATLEIPNKLFLLWQEKLNFQGLLGCSVSKHSYLVNEAIEGGTVNMSANLDTKLRKEMSRVCNQYKKLRGGSRENLEAKVTKVLLFKGELTRMATPASPNELHFHGKPYEELGERQQRRRRQQIKENIVNHTSALKEIGLDVVSMKLQTTNSKNDIDLRVKPISSNCRETDKVDPDDKDKENSVTFMTLKNGISMTNYHELSMVFKDLPRSHKVKKCKDDIVVPDISKTPGIEGAQFKFSSILLDMAETEIVNNPDVFRSMEIHIKISIDGAKYSRYSNYCLLSLAIMNEEFTLSSKNIQIIAAIKGSENYENLASGFKDVFNEINSYIAKPSIQIQEEEYKLIFYLCSDYKMLLQLFGLKEANSSYACLWCNVEKNERFDMEKTLESFTKRTIEGLLDSRSPRDLPAAVKEQKQSQIHAPLIHLQPQYVIPDELHLLLRVTDVLTRNLINAAIQHDIKQSGHRRHVNILSGEMVKKLLDEIHDCGISFNIFQQKAPLHGFEFTSLMGKEKGKLLNHLPSRIPQCQPAEFCDTVQQLWEDFERLHDLIKRANTNSEADFVEAKAKSWIRLFLSLSPHCDGYQPSCITPYMHIMVFHIPECIRQFGNLKKYSCQGVEKKNDDAKTAYFNASNRWDPAKDILQNDYKIRALKFCTRKKRIYRKRNKDYWDWGGIQEDRRKRPRISKTDT